MKVYLSDETYQALLETGRLQNKSPDEYAEEIITEFFETIKDVSVRMEELQKE